MSAVKKNPGNRSIFSGAFFLTPEEKEAAAILFRRDQAKIDRLTEQLAVANEAVGGLTMAVEGSFDDSFTQKIDENLGFQPTKFRSLIGWKLKLPYENVVGQRPKFSSIIRNRRYRHKSKLVQYCILVMMISLSSVNFYDF